MELEEAIKHWKNNLDKWKKDRPDLSNTEIVEEIDYDYKAIETVLNHLKQKERELNYQKNYCKMIEESKNDIIKSMAERITKQEKMIELMIEHIKTGCDFDNRIQNASQIKQYFEKKAEESE